MGVSSDLAGSQPFSVNIDFTAPALASAVTGTWWAASKTITDKTETDVTKAKNTSIRVDFTNNMCGTTIQVSDFKVAGVAPLASEWQSVRPRVFLHGPSVGGQRTSQDRFGRRSEGRSRQLFQLKLDFCVQLRDRPNNYGYSDRHRGITASHNWSSCDKNYFRRKCIDPVSDRLEYRQPQSDDRPVHFYFGARDPTERQHT